MSREICLRVINGGRKWTTQLFVQSDNLIINSLKLFPRDSYNITTALQESSLQGSPGIINELHSRPTVNLNKCKNVINGDVIFNSNSTSSNQFQSMSEAFESSFGVPSSQKCSLWKLFCDRRTLVAIIIVCIITTGILAYLLLLSTADRPSISTTATTLNPIIIKTRQDWGAAPPKRKHEKEELSEIVKKIIVTHTFDDSWANLGCGQIVREIQIENSHLNDIPYNYLIGDDGFVYEGQFERLQSEHPSTLNGSAHNDIGICVAFIVTYEKTQPSKLQLETLHNFIDTFVDRGIIDSDYNLTHALYAGSCKEEESYSVLHGMGVIDVLEGQGYDFESQLTNEGLYYYIFISNSI